jgi:hypothetical protein
MDIVNNKLNEISNDNITFFLVEKEKEKDQMVENKENFIQQMMEELETEELETDELEFENQNPSFPDVNKLMYFIDKDFYGNDELYYNQEYTIKDLLKICDYYGLEKNIKSSKCKKQDIISTIIYFESLPENYEIVQKRNIMWAYMGELMMDTKMKKYIFWN